MSKYFDALIWIDRLEAKIFHISADEASKVVVNPEPSVPDSHQRPSQHGTYVSADARFFRRVAGAIEATKGTLITGPGNIKFELKEFLDSHDPRVAARILGVETVEPTGDEDLIARGRRFFETRGHRADSPGLSSRRPGHP